MRAELKRQVQQLIEERLFALEASASENEELSPVSMDQQSVGRLSRMDAMQRQAMAKETARRRDCPLSDDLGHRRSSANGGS